MSSIQSQLEWTNPEYVTTVVGVLAAAGLLFYSSISNTGPTVGEILFVLLGLTIPMTIARHAVRRWN